MPDIEFDFDFENKVYEVQVNDLPSVGNQNVEITVTADGTPPSDRINAPVKIRRVVDEDGNITFDQVYELPNRFDDSSKHLVQKLMKRLLKQCRNDS